MPEAPWTFPTLADRRWARRISMRLPALLFRQQMAAIR
jgi:hypothetical protein